MKYYYRGCLGTKELGAKCGEALARGRAPGPLINFCCLLPCSLTPQTVVFFFAWLLACHCPPVIVVIFFAWPLCALPLPLRLQAAPHHHWEGPGL